MLSEEFHDERFLSFGCEVLIEKDRRDFIGKFDFKN